MSSLASMLSRFLPRPPQDCRGRSRRRRSSRNRIAARPPLRLEHLEERAMMAGFTFADFSNASGLSLLGDASITADNRLRLTPAAGGMEGAAWFTADKQFVGTAFESTFQFQLTENFHSPGGSDGLVFILQNTAPTYLSGGGGTLGYYGLKNSLAVEFDTYQNSEVNDPSQSHISIHTNGTGPNDWRESLSLGSYDTSPGLLDDAAVHTVKIAYTPGTLSVYLDNLTTPKLTVSVDLAEILNLDGGKAWAGFTATTGGGWQNHDILNWTYAVVPDVSTTVWVDDVSVVEGDSGTSSLVFTVTRAGDTSGAATVNWATESRSAIAGSDYGTASGQVVFGPGVTDQTLTISVNGDTAVEPSESLALRLSGASGATIADGVGIGTISTDDVTISVSDDTAVEGGRGLKLLGQFVEQGSGGLSTPKGSVFGPDANGDGARDLYVASSSSDAILRYDGATGSFIDAFVPSGRGGLDYPLDVAFDPDGNLYVSTGSVGKIYKYDATGSFLDVVVSGLSRPLGLAFDPDGNLYIADGGTDEVFRYNSSGLSVFVGAGSGGLDEPFGAAFGPDGNLYVASQATGQVLRYSGTTGAPMGPFATTLGLRPIWLKFGADGYLYTTVRTSGTNVETSIVRFDASTGAFVDQFDLGRDGWAFTLGPDGLVYNSSNSSGDFIERIGSSSTAAFTVTLSSASAAAVIVSYATADLQAPSALAGSDYAAVSGTLTFAPGETTKTVLVQTINDAIGEPQETFSVSLSNPVGGTIADGSATGTIKDDDATKFYVVDDAATNRTYEYADTSNSIENYTLDTGNTAPRGAASTAAGDKVWVVDANRTVYVYNTSGGLRGSWTAGTLKSTAKVEGIAVAGNDVWIVDDASNKVYKYAGAASLLDGSVTATSFNLNRANKSPKDIVTDGTHLWVVNDSTTDTVFKYTLGGSLVASWTISTSGATSPTGITLDPTNPAHLWIVDNGTDRVYEYANAVNQANGSSKSADASFALATGNSNPQGIADPPVAFNDPDYATLQWGLDNVGQNGGTYDVDIDAPEAWTVTTGSMKTVVAEIERGVPYAHPDIYLNIWLNQAEIPATLWVALSDMDRDGIITFRDLNDPANAAFVTDLNGTGYIDGGDLLQDPRWANGLDDAGNGYVDDLVGWDFVDNDNDPTPPANDDHGLRMTQWIGAIPNNGVGYVGVNRLVSVMPIRTVGAGSSWDFDPQTGAAGLDYSIANGAPIAGIWGGGYTFSQVLYDAIARGRDEGQLVVVPIGNDATNTDVTPRYPASFDLDNIISVTAFNANDGMDAAWNWGLTTVDLGSPTNPNGGTSGGAANVAAVAALLKTVHPEWGYQQLKERIRSTVEPSAALAGKCVTGGRLNAANALGYAWSPTKFYVVNDATFDQTYEYESTVEFITANGLGSGNTAPRGAATTAAGDKVWVVDANRKVYVYNTSGGLLGSWTAGTLKSTAKVEGIAVAGKDVWIVDDASNKVYKYAGAASLLDGIATATTFNLNTANKSPKDIVTDGTNLWVVNDSTTDKVFKYTLGGSLVGSWTITTSGATSPTGLTIDPAGASQDIWIVDSGTGRVYQYANARSPTSGSLSAATSFALAAGNTNPQGIADPPSAVSRPLGPQPMMSGSSFVDSAAAGGLNLVGDAGYTAASREPKPGAAADLSIGLTGFEPSIAVNPFNANNVVVATRGSGMKISLDGGVTFPITRGIVVPSGQSGGGSDPSLTFDSQGRLFWSYLSGGSPEGGIASVQVNPATGDVIGDATLVVNGNNLDKGWIAADQNPSSPFHDNLYVIWHDFNQSNVNSIAPVRIARSIDQGATWTTMSGKVSGKNQGFTWPSEVAVAPNGDVWVAWHTKTGEIDGEVRMRRSTDGGVTFEREVIPFPAGTAATTTNSSNELANKISGLHVWLQGSMQPRILIDPARPGNIYVISVDDPDEFVTTDDPSDIVLARSTDNGATWTRTTISQGIYGDIEIMPSAAIDARGNVAVTWYDNRRHLTVPDSLGGTHYLLDLYSTTSVDGGLSFSTPALVNDPANPFDPELGAPDRFGNHTLRIGEYNGAAVVNGTAYAVWTGNGAGQETYFDKFSFASMPYIAASFPSAVEGPAGSNSAATFTVQRVGSLTGQAVVDWATADGTAAAGSDYVAASGQVVFQDGESQRAVPITLIGDNASETNETFRLLLSTTTPGYAVGMGQATILNDDATISISDATVIEGSDALKLLGRFVNQGSGGLSTPRGSVFGPDGNGDGARDLYVASGNANAVLRYDGATGSFIDAFVPSGSGGLDDPVDLAFDPDGNLYVSTGIVGKIYKYDATGSFLDVVVSGLSRPLGLAFDPDGNLYIADKDTDEVFRYNSSGLSVFVGAGSGGLDEPFGAAFGPDGNLYVASQATGQVLRYSGTTGAPMGPFATTLGLRPIWLKFGADGYLYTTVRTSGTNVETSIVRFDASTGAFVDQFDLGRDGWAFTIGPDGLVYNSSNGSGDFIERLGPSSIAAFTVSLSSPSAAAVIVNYATADLEPASALASSDYVSAPGTLTFAPGETTKTVLVPTLDDADIEGTETFLVNLSNPVGAILGDGQGLGTIQDNDTAGNANDMYVWDIAFGSRTRGDKHDERVLVTVRRDSDADGAAEAGDAAVSAASVTVELRNSSGGLVATLSGTTDAAGVFTSSWVNNVANGSNVAEVTALAHGTFAWNGALDPVLGNDTDLDGDGLPDESHTVPHGSASSTNSQSAWASFVLAADRASPQGIADAVFQLAAGNTNPQGIADPPGDGAIATSSPAAAVNADVASAAARTELLDAAILAALRPAADAAVESLVSARLAGGFDRPWTDSKPNGADPSAYHASRSDTPATVSPSAPAVWARRHALRGTAARTAESIDRILEAWSHDDEEPATPSRSLRSRLSAASR